jgi:RNA polymerase sigma factor (TIGR02999 family)
MEAPPPPPDEITRILQDWEAGSRDAFDRLIPIVYDELRTLASRQVAREWRHDRLHTTTLVHEAYLRLFGQREIHWENRRHFFAIAAQLMRRILVDNARRELRDKRGRRAEHVDLAEAASQPTDVSLEFPDALALDAALQKLEALDPEQARIVELRFFGGLTVEETAAVVAVSPATVKREWSLAKGWLYRELASD